MRQESSIPLSDGSKIRIRYACEAVSPETYYDHLHDHSFLEVCILLSGSMLHFSGGHTYRLSFGDIFFARPGELHYALAAEKSVYERYAFWIPADAFSFLLSGAESTVAAFTDPKRGEGRVFRLKSGSEGELLERLSHLRESLAGEESLVIFGRLCEVLSFINKNAPDEISESYGDKEEIPAVIHKVIRYVRDNYQTLSGVDEIAQKFYINRDYLTRVFSKHVGMTVHDYIRIIRINRARTMLSDKRGVTETAYACGFNSTSYFIRVFSKAVGMTPAKFRACEGELPAKNHYITEEYRKSRKS